jgi:hypothetical protein
VISKDVPVALIGENFDLTYKYEHLGNDVNILTDILYDKN